MSEPLDRLMNSFMSGSDVHATLHDVLSARAARVVPSSLSEAEESQHSGGGSSRSSHGDDEDGLGPPPEEIMLRIAEGKLQEEVAERKSALTGNVIFFIVIFVILLACVLLLIASSYQVIDLSQWMSIFSWMRSPKKQNVGDFVIDRNTLRATSTEDFPNSVIHPLVLTHEGETLSLNTSRQYSNGVVVKDLHQQFLLPCTVRGFVRSTEMDAESGDVILSRTLTLPFRGAHFFQSGKVMLEEPILLPSTSSGSGTGTSDPLSVSVSDVVVTFLDSEDQGLVEFSTGSKEFTDNAEEIPFPVQPGAIAYINNPATRVRLTVRVPASQSTLTTSGDGTKVTFQFYFGLLGLQTKYKE